MVFFRNKRFMLDEMAIFEAFYQVISSSKKPLISEYIVLIVGQWKKNIGAAHLIGIQECKFFKFPTKFCVVTSDFISDSSIPVNAETWAPSLSVVSNSQFVGSDFLEGSNEFFLYCSSVLVDKPVVVHKGFPKLGLGSAHFWFNIGSKFGFLGSSQFEVWPTVKLETVWSLYFIQH